MTDNELKKLGRKELLEILIEQGREIERLRAALKEAEDRARSRDILVSKAGSLAEAALALNKVFESADAAAKQYLENIRSWNDRQQDEYRQIIDDAERKAAEITAGAQEAVRPPEKQHKSSDESWEETLRTIESYDWFKEL